MQPNNPNKTLVVKRKGDSEDEFELVEVEPKPDSEDIQGVFMVAIENGDLKTIEELMEKSKITNLNFVFGVFPSKPFYANFEELYGMSPLMCAVRAHAIHPMSPNIVSFLLSRGANPNVVCQWETPLMRACYRYRRYDMSPPSTREYDFSQPTRTDEERQADMIEMVKLLIQYGTDVNLRDSNGWSCLHFSAIGTPMLELASILIESGCDPHLKNSEGLTAKDRLLQAINQQLDDSDPKGKEEQKEQRNYLRALEAAILEQRTKVQQLLITITAFSRSVDIVTLISRFVY